MIVFPYINSIDVGGSLIGGEQAGCHVESGCLTRAVGTDKAVEGALGDIEGEVCDGNQVSENFYEATNCECRRLAFHRSLRR